jgi:hydrogenase large subunit
VTRIVIDPVTRAGGPLRVEADVTAGKVTAAYASATMFRGMEAVLKGRDPRDAWLLAQRICGTCTGAHALASVRAVEHALGVAIPPNARLIRNLMAGIVLVRDHVMTLYLRNLPDWVDASVAITADPLATSRLARERSAWLASEPTRFAALRDRLAAEVNSGRPGMFAAAFAGHPAYRLSPEESLLLLAHALDALDWQRELMRAHTLFGGKEAHPQTYLMGGMALVPPWGGPEVSRTRQHPQVPDRSAPLALGDTGLALVRTQLDAARTFVEQVVIPDTLLLMEAYPDWLATGAGPGSYLCAGDFPQDDALSPALLFPNGKLAQGNLERSEPAVEAAVTEMVQHAWYQDPDGDSTPRPPAKGVTEPAYTSGVPLAQLDGSAKYTWVKAARVDGLAMETGPLARVLVGAANGQAEISDALGRLLTQTGLTRSDILGTLGRSLARAVELDVMTTALRGWLDDLEVSLGTGDLAVASMELWDPVSWPSEAEGASFAEGPRGSIGHWVRIRDAVIDHYQVIDGSSWNLSPRGSLGLAGPVEAGLAGVDVADPAQPVELLRVIHSFAPCAACAAHVATGSGGCVSDDRPEGTR